MGRNIAAVIDPKAVNKRTHLEGTDYIITWAIGHLIGLAEPDKYDDKYKKWNFHDLPIIPDIFKLLPNFKTKDQLAVIAQLAKGCDKLVNACDAGREGQHIFSLIQRHLHLMQPVKRLWISDLTPETIRRGFDNLKDGAEYENLTKAAKARSEADWLVGMNGTRAFTAKHNVLLSVGRVQTPVLALIYDRQKQIESFDSLKYFEVEGHFSQEDTLYKGMWQGDRITNRQKADEITAKVKGKRGSIISYEVKETKEYPFKLFDLTLLQREANGKYGFSAKKTLDLAQALYEKHKAISYPRTNANYVTEQNIPEMHKALDSLKGTAYDEWVKGANKSLVHKGNRYVCNPSKVEDHHAILPTAKKPSGLTPDEQKIYDLVVRRFLSHFYRAAEYKVHTVMTLVEQETFRTIVKELLDLGWKVIYQDQAKEKAKSKPTDEDEIQEEEVNTPFSVNAQTTVLCVDAQTKEKDTQPPKHFTEGTLLKAMESAGKQVEDEELRDAMKDSGLGTPATRAATIERLKSVEYIEMQGKKITITNKGRMAVELIRGAGIELLTSPEMTGHWERRLNEISKGMASDITFMDNVKKFTRLIIEKVGAQQRAAKEAFISAEPVKKTSKKNVAATQDAQESQESQETQKAQKAQNATSAQGKKTPAASRSTSVKTPVNKNSNPVILTKCPRTGCGGDIFMGRKGYGCSKYKDGCKFVIWKVSFGKTLSDSMVKSLIEKGKTSKLKLLDESGQPIEAKIVFRDSNNGELALEL